MSNPILRWRTAFPGIPLVAHQLRDSLADRWLRIHSLPDSQRYPSSDGDYRELLRRQNTILNETLRDGKSTLFVTEPSADELATLAAICDSPLSVREYLPIGDLAPEEYGVGATWDLHAIEFTNAPGALDFWLRSVADGNQVNAIIVNADYSRICHPYDGGMDLILASTEERDQFGNLHSDWLSQHPSGM